MSIGGEFNQHLQGNRANVIRQFSLLSLIGNIDSTSKTTGTLKVTGGIGATGNIFANGLTIANSTEATLYLNTAAISGTASQVWQINGTNKMSIGWTTGAGISINDLANVGSTLWLYQSGGAAGNVNTLNNILDDGANGNLTAKGLFSKGYVVARYDKGVYWNDGAGPGGANYFSITSSTSGGLTFSDQHNSTTPFTISSSNGDATISGSTPLILQSSTSGGCSVSFNTAASTHVGTFGYSSIAGWNLVNGSGQYIFRQSGGTTSEKSFRTNNNILDDGNGYAIISTATTATNTPLIINAPTSNGTYLGIEIGGTSKAAFGYGTSGQGIGIYDYANGQFWLTQGGTTAGNIQTKNNILDDGANGDLTTKRFVVAGKTFPMGTTTESTLAAGNQTITAAEMLGYFIFSPSQSGNFIWTFDTGANIYAAMGSPPVGTTVPFLVTNGTGFACVFAFGTGVTNKLRVGSITNSTLMCYARVTGTNTIDMISQ